MDLQKIDCPKKSLNDYEKLAPETIGQIKGLARSLKGLNVVHINATAVGGGPAEMFRSEIALLNDAGLNSSWYVLPPSQKFFEVTKKIHNLAQGQEGDLTKEEKDIYLKYNGQAGKALSKLNPRPDILIIHDPQPLASVNFFTIPSKLVWRSHIDTTAPNENIWKFLSQFFPKFDYFIFTLPDFVPVTFPFGDKISFITPAIDPFSAKNVSMDRKQAKANLKKFGIDINKPLITQISRLDPWKDPLGVVDAYRLAKKQIPDLQLAMVTQSATDDPEGEIILAKMQDYINNESGIFLLVNVADNDQAINAFQTGSDIILQKSLREGFGLTVTEALYKGALVIGGNAGGLKYQITDGENGFLINSTEEMAEKIVYVLKHPEIKEKISIAARKSVEEKSLIPNMLLQNLYLFKKLIKK